MSRGSAMKVKPRSCFEAVNKIDRAGVGVEGVEVRSPISTADPKRHQQHVAIVTVRRWFDHKTLQAIAERKECRRDQTCGRGRGSRPKFLKGEESREQRGAEQRAMREVERGALRKSASARARPTHTPAPVIRPLMMAVSNMMGESTLVTSGRRLLQTRHCEEPTGPARAARPMSKKPTKQSSLASKGWIAMSALAMT